MVAKLALSVARQAAATARKAVGTRGATAKASTTSAGTTTKATKAAPAKKAATKAAPAKKAPAKAAPATKAASPTTAAPAATSTTTPRKAATVTNAAPAASTTPATKAPATKAAAKKAAARKPVLAVREDESPWTAKELRAVRSELEHDIQQLRSEVANAQSDLVDLMRDSGDGAGDDQADAGAKTYEREQEISLANNAREMLEQNEHALERLDNGTYGICESCGNPIGKLRLQAAPRATLCMPCKMKQERR